MDIDLLIEDIKKELSNKPMDNSQNRKVEDFVFKSPINESIYKNLGDFGVINETHKEGHQGIDLGAPKGTAVFPIISGKVVKTGTDPKGGNIVVMEHVVHNSKYRSYYAHLNTIDCKIGDSLSQEDKLGTVGDSGNAKGRANHLHLQVWKDGKLINPATLFNFKKYKKASLNSKINNFLYVLKQNGFF